MGGDTTKGGRYCKKLASFSKEVERFVGGYVFKSWFELLLMYYSHTRYHRNLLSQVGRKCPKTVSSLKEGWVT